MAITNAQQARQLYRFGGDTMGGPNDRSTSGPGPDDRSSAEQTMNTRAAIRDAQRSNRSKTSNATNTIGDAMLLRNIINFNPMGIMKNIGSKVLFDKLSRVNPEEGEEDNMLLADALTTPTEETMGLNLIDRKTLNNAGYSNTQIEELQNNPNIDTQDVIRDIKGPIFAAEGGIMNTDVVGGEMDFESARQMYGFGKLVKKVTRSVKKIAKSPIGKAALIYAGGAGLGALGAGSAGTGFKLFGSKSFLAPGNVFSNLMTSGRNLGLLKRTIGTSDGPGMLMERIGPLSNLGVGSLITGASAVSGLLTAEQEEEAQQIADNTGIDIAEIRANPDKYLGRRFRAEGGSMDEPVAKKTMPLLDMGGKEMDLRAEGGFVPIGRMEKADDVPARLSKNEFVFTADAVRNAGEGDVDKGAEVMYNMMKNLESGGDVSEESQGLEGARKMFQTSQRLEEVL